MPQLRHLGSAVAIAAVLLLVLASVASAHPGHHRWRHGFDNVWKDAVGDAGVNSFTATPGDRDKIIGRDGDDVLDAGDKHDHVHGGRGNDTIDGGEGRDILRGGPNDDTITGGPGRDFIMAGWGNDTVDALDGQRDWIRCGPGEDDYMADAIDRVAPSCENDITPA
jgi:hypothetical protein